MAAGASGERNSWKRRVKASVNHNSCRLIHQPLERPGCYTRGRSPSRRGRLEGFCRPISRVLYPSSDGRMVTIYLAQPPALRPAEVRHWRIGVTAAVKQPTRGRAGHLSPPIWPCSRWGLAAAASPQSAGRSYRPISPLSFHCWKDGMFLCHFPFPTPANQRSGPGSYPAPCPEEPGLSSLLPSLEERRSPGLHGPPFRTLA